MAVNPRGRARKRRSPGNSIRDRLDEAEATLKAIRLGQVDALVVSGPSGEQTLTIEGATHPYFVLLNAMSDGATLLDHDGAILFCNRSFSDIARASADTLIGAPFQRLVAPAMHSIFEEFLREGSGHGAAREFALVTGNGSTTPVSIALSMLPLGEEAEPTGSQSRRSTIALMAIITDLTYRKAAEATRARLLEHVMSAEEEERRRIARELHDETGQSLTALLVGLRAITQMAVPAEVRPVALRLRDIAAQTVDDVGRMARGLHPAVLDDKGLAAAARRYVGDYERSFGTVVEFAAGDLDSPRLAPVDAATMYRILQEALTNVARHARAKKIVVELRRDDAALELMVRDDGVGFEVPGARLAVAGLGLRGMRERVTLLGGLVEIDSRPGQGTVVHARIPCNRAPPREQPRGAGSTRVAEESLS